MPEVISFLEAINATEGEDKALLIGNGFSAQYFNYANLLAEAQLEGDSPIRVLFDRLGTVDFEAVIRALEAATIVERAYGNDRHADQLELDAQTVREALVTAVNATHPAHREELEFQYESAGTFLKHFGKVFSLNYDLLLYWVNLEKRLLKDGFGLGKDVAQGRFKGPFFDHAYCHIFNLHGGLHLFQNKVGEVYKALNHGEGVIANITHEIAHNRRLPLYVAEGTSTSKMRKINSVEYLRHCYRTLQETTAAVFVFGHSADPNDAHVYNAVFASKANMSTSVSSGQTQKSSRPWMENWRSTRNSVVMTSRTVFLTLILLMSGMARHSEKLSQAGLVKVSDDKQIFCP